MTEYERRRYFTQGYNQCLTDWRLGDGVQVFPDQHDLGPDGNLTFDGFRALLEQKGYQYDLHATENAYVGYLIARGEE